MTALLVDVGNSRVKWRAVDLDTADGEPPRWRSAERALAVRDIDALDAALRAPDAVPAEAPDLVLVANVASDAVGHAVERAIGATWPRATVRHVRTATASCGLVNGYHDPQQLGVDRWLAAVAAHVLHPDRSVLVCTFGTATTIDLVERDDGRAPGARFVGGLILPGFDAMRDALTRTTARLPAGAGRVVDFGDRTDDAIASGVMAAQTGAVARALANVHARRPPSAASPPPMCVVAGGAGSRVVAALVALDTPHRLVHDLVLRGLAQVGREAITAADRPALPTPT